MARLIRAELFDPEEIAVVHTMNRVVRCCRLLGYDPVTKKHYGHRKRWLVKRMRTLASLFGIDLLAYAVLSNHLHQILRSRPDVVRTWDDTEVARRWLTLCPPRRPRNGVVLPLTESDLNTIRCCPKRLAEIRRRLSDISWWMRLLCQPLGIQANREDQHSGKFFESRFRAVRLCDDEALLAGTAYVDLNVLRASLAKTLETSEYTSIHDRLRMLQHAIAERNETASEPVAAEGVPGAGEWSTQAPVQVAADTASDTQVRIKTDAQSNGPLEEPRRQPDDFLAPLFLDEQHAPLGPQPHQAGRRCSDKGFLPMPMVDYAQLLDWTARQIAPGKSGHTPADTPPVLDRLGLTATIWTELVTRFGELFSQVAGRPNTLDELRSRKSQRCFRQRRSYRELMATRRPPNSSPAAS